MIDGIPAWVGLASPVGATLAVFYLVFTGGGAAAAPGLYSAVTNQSPETATGAGLTALVVSAAITRLMAHPFVNEWLTKAGLGAEPK